MAKTTTTTDPEGNLISRAEQVEDQHSVKYSLNAKGEVAFEVKAYGSTPDIALQSARELFCNALISKFEFEAAVKGRLVIRQEDRVGEARETLA